MKLTVLFCLNFHHQEQIIRGITIWEEKINDTYIPALFPDAPIRVVESHCIVHLFRYHLLNWCAGWRNIDWLLAIMMKKTFVMSISAGFGRLCAKIVSALSIVAIVLFTALLYLLQKFNIFYNRRCSRSHNSLRGIHSIHSIQSTPTLCSEAHQPIPTAF